MAGRRTWLAVTLVFVVCPCVASAADYCVPNTAIAGCPADGLQATDFATAVADVNTGTANVPNTITVGASATPYVSDNQDVDFQHPVAIIGAGPGQTVLQGDPASAFVLSLDNASSSISGVTINVPDNASGLSLRGSANRVAVHASQTGQGVIGVSLIGFDGPTLSNSTVSLPFSPTVTNTAVFSSSTGTTVQNTSVVQDSTIAGGVGLDHVAVVLRDRITANVGYQAASSQVAPSAVFDDDLIVTSAGSAPEAGIEVAPIYASPPTVTIRHVTVIGDGAPGSVGVGLLPGAYPGFPTAEGVTANLDSSIVRGYAASLSAAATGGPAASYAQPDTSTINISHSDYDTKLTRSMPGANAASTATATINFGAGVNTGAPQFITTSAGDPRAYRQLMTSPGIDSGDARLAPGEPTTDLDGAPRIAVTGTTDMGAFEHTPAAPAVTLKLSPVDPVAGRQVTFTATATDANPGDVFTYRWSFDGHAAAGGAAIAHTFPRLGRHTVSVTVREIDGLLSTESRRLVVATGGLTRLRLSRGSFSPGSGRHGGAIVSYRDPLGGKAVFKVQRRKGMHWVTITKFAHRDTIGDNSVRFTGLVHGHRLGPDHYRLNAGNGAGKAEDRGFTIL